MEPDRPDSDERKLDRLLAKARWPESGAQRLARLDEHWRQLRRARRRRLAMYGALASAASVLIVAGIFAWRARPTPPTAPEQPIAGSIVQPTPEQRPAPSGVANHEPPQPPPAVGRERTRDPSLYEQVVLLGKFPKREPPRRSRPKRAPGEVSVDELIARLGERHDADVAAGLADLQADLPGSEQMLWDAVRQAEGKRRLGAARLLARIGTHRSLGVLIELAGDSLTHEAAVLGLARLAAAPEVARLAASEPDPRLRQHLLAGLLARRTSESTGYYLGLVQQPRTRSDALAAVVAMDDPPAEMLLDYLDSPQSSLRLAAAQALSRLADPAVAERLCQSLGGIGRQEALMALLLSSSDQAADCLRHARQNIYLMAAVQAAEQQLYSLDLQRGGNLP